MLLSQIKNLPSVRIEDERTNAFDLSFVRTEPIRLLWQWEIPMSEQDLYQTNTATTAMAARRPRAAAPCTAWQPHDEIIELLAEMLVASMPPTSECPLTPEGSE